MSKCIILKITRIILICGLAAFDWYFGYHQPIQAAIEEHKRLGIYFDAFAKIQAMEITWGLALVILISLPLVWLICIQTQDMIEEDKRRKQIHELEDYYYQKTGERVKLKL